MSLIDEALKRAQAAHQDEARPGGGERPWTPVPLPDGREASRRRALRIAGVLVVAGAIGVAAWLLLPAARNVPPPASKGPSSAAPTAVPATPAPLEEVIVAPPSRGVSAAQPTRGPAATAKPAAPAAAGSADASPPAPAPGNPAPGRPAGSLQNGHTYVGSISLSGGAKIELGGIVYSEANASALVNGRIVGTGAYIEGFTVVRIEQTRVELEGNGLTIFLSLR